MKCAIKALKSRSVITHYHLHTNDKSYVCGVCGKAFLEKSGLANHSAVHNNEKCPVCGKPFKHPKYIRIYLRGHTGEKPFNCDTCLKSFRSNSNLKSHLDIHTDKRSCLSMW